MGRDGQLAVCLRWETESQRSELTWSRSQRWDLSLVSPSSLGSPVPSACVSWPHSRSLASTGRAPGVCA